MIIPNGTVIIIISWNDALPADGEDISYHGPNNRYPLSVIILNTISQPLIITPADKIETLNFSVNVKLFSFILLSFSENRIIYVLVLQIGILYTVVLKDVCLICLMQLKIFLKIDQLACFCANFLDF
jgi:hypothetical protein